MKRLIGLSLLSFVFLLPACDTGLPVDANVDEDAVAAKGAVKSNLEYEYCFDYATFGAAMTDAPLPCLTGSADTWTRTEGCMFVEGTRIDAPGGRLVTNWNIRYGDDRTHLSIVEIDGFDGEVVEGGQTWSLLKGNQNAHDVAYSEDWTEVDPNIAPYSSGPGLHQYSMHEWYRNDATGEVQNIMLPMIFFYDGADPDFLVGPSPTMQRLAKHGFCPGQSMPQ